jgi:hypothetical protein
MTNELLRFSTKSGKGENPLLSGVWGCPPIYMSPNVWGTIRGFGYCFPLTKGDFRGLTIGIS